MAGLPSYESVDYDGESVLTALIQSTGLTKLELMARYTLFSDPKVVEQTNNAAVFRIIRNPGRRGECDDALRVVLDDNSTPRDLFLKANNLPLRLRKIGNQFNHVYKRSDGVEHYTALANICMTPQFLARLTDVDEEVVGLLQYRAFRLFRYPTHICGYELEKPKGYDALESLWPSVIGVPDLRRTLGEWIRKAQKSRAAISAARYGWLFQQNLS